MIFIMVVIIYNNLSLPNKVIAFSLHLSPTGIDFSRDGTYMALAERRDCKDYVSVFVCDDWHLLRVRSTLESDLSFMTNIIQYCLDRLQHPCDPEKD